MLSYAIDDRDSFRGLIQWREEFIKYADVKSDRFPFIVVGNKNDIEPALRQISQEEVNGWCQEHHITAWIETSAKKSTNVQEAFILAVKQWQHLERMTEREMRAQGDTVDLTRGVHLTQNSRGCCGSGTGGNGTRTSISNQQEQL